MAQWLTNPTRNHEVASSILGLPMAVMASTPGPLFFFLSFFFVVVVVVIVVVAISWAPPAAYGGSQARGLIRAAAASLCLSHSHARPSDICDPGHSLWQCQILNPLSKGRDRTHNLMVPSRIH